MTIRLDYFKHPAAREPLTALSALSGSLHGSTLDPVLRGLIQLYASQLNGCAFCVDMHTKELVAAGAEEPKVYLLTTWREAGIYSAREVAALAWTEAMTWMKTTTDWEALYENLAAQFSEVEIVAITFTIVTINSWNRLSVSFGRRPGNYQPGDLDKTLQQAVAVLRR